MGKWCVAAAALAVVLAAGVAIHRWADLGGETMSTRGEGPAQPAQPADPATPGPGPEAVAEPTHATGPAGTVREESSAAPPDRPLNLCELAQSLSLEEADRLSAPLAERQRALHARVVYSADRELTRMGFELQESPDGTTAYVHPELRLTDDQHQQLKWYQEALAPRQQAALNKVMPIYKEAFAKREELRRKYPTPQAQAAARDELEPISAEVQRLERRLSETQHAFDQEYLTLARGILTAEQAAEFDRRRPPAQ